MRSRLTVLWTSLLYGMGAEGAAAAQCAMCRSTLQGAEVAHLAAAYREAIALLFVAPFLVFTVVALAVGRLCRPPRGAAAPDRGTCRVSGSTRATLGNSAARSGGTALA